MNSMKPALYTATGCTRCGIVKTFMTERDLPFEELDIKGAGRSAFNRFYRENQPLIFRGAQGIEFPIFADQGVLKQGVGVILAWLQAGDRLDGLVTTGTLSHGWIDGLNVSGGGLDAGEDFFVVLRYLKQHGLKTEVAADGRNASLLAQMVGEKQADLLTFTLLGPPAIYADLPNRPVDEVHLRQSLALVAQAPHRRIILQVGPVLRKGAEPSYLTPEEAAQAAALAAAATGDRRLPFWVQMIVPPEKSMLEPLPPATAFKYRTAVRRHMIAAEILK